MATHITIIKTTLLAATVICIAVGFMLMYLGYDGSLLHYMALLGVQTYEQNIRALVSPKVFSALIMLSFIAATLCAFLYYKAAFIGAKAALVAKALSQTLQGFLVRNTALEYISVLALPISIAVYHACSMPISYDEAWTYLNFTRRGVAASLAYYPAPNNHIFYSLCTNFFALLPIDATLSLRLPVVLSQAVTLVLTFDLLKKLIHRPAALIATGLMAFFSMNLYYSYVGRGYAFVLMWFVLASYAAFQLVQSPRTHKYWLYFSIAALMGFWTMPSFLYPWLSLQAFITLNLKRITKEQLLYALGTAMLVGIVYAPVVLINGLEALTNNPYVRQQPRTEVIKVLPEFVGALPGEIVGIAPMVANLIVLVLLLLVLWHKITRTQLLFLLVFAAMPFLLLTAHSVVPFVRTFYYYSFVLALLIAIALKTLDTNIKGVYVYGSIAIAQLSFYLHFFERIKVEDGYAIAVAQNIDEIAKAKSVYCNSGTYETYYVFYTRDLRPAPALYYCPPRPASVDTIPQTYDYYILDRPIDKTTYLKPIYSNNYFSIYRK